MAPPEGHRHELQPWWRLCYEVCYHIHVNHARNFRRIGPQNERVYSETYSSSAFHMVHRSILKPSLSDYRFCGFVIAEQIEWAGLHANGTAITQRLAALRITELRPAVHGVRIE